LFNWFSAPTFLAMLLFWILGGYVLTRSPRSAISLTAVGAQFATALYLLGQGMLANAQTIEEWRPWARNLQWGSHVAPLLWYWLTVLLLGEQSSPRVRAYLRFFGYPLGVVIGLGTLFFVTTIYSDDLLHLWSQIAPNPPGKDAYSRFALPNGPLYVGFVGLLAASTIASAANVWLGWRNADTAARRRCFRWLLVSALLFIAGADGLGIVNWSTGGPVPTWVGHMLLAAAMVVMAWNVAAYSLLFKGEVVRRDFFYVLTARSLVCVLYGLVLVISGAAYSFQLLALTAVILSLAVLSHAFVDLGRGLLDQLFFGSDVQAVRRNLNWSFQSAGRARNLDTVLFDVQTGMAEVAADRLVGLTEQALRRLNNPASLGACELGDRISATLDARTHETAGRGLEDATPLERAQAMRSLLISTIERMKPIDDGAGAESPAALQYRILHEEYLQGLLNKQIMTRHSISEGTFNRNRRQAIRMLADELAKQEQLLSKQKVAAFGAPSASFGSQQPLE